jgi:hypothetical protein
MICQRLAEAGCNLSANVFEAGCSLLAETAGH